MHKYLSKKTTDMKTETIPNSHPKFVCKIRLRHLKQELGSRWDEHRISHAAHCIRTLYCWQCAEVSTSYHPTIWKKLTTPVFCSLASYYANISFTFSSKSWGLHIPKLLRSLFSNCTGISVLESFPWKW